MATTIENSGASIKITENGAIRFILKYQIREVDIVRGNTLKIDIGQGVLNNIFIDRANVTTPVTATIEELREFIIAMLQSSAAGNATEAKQNEEIAQIINLQNIITDMMNELNSSSGDCCAYSQPSIVDETEDNVVYNGFAEPGANEEASVWAIQKVSKVNGIYYYRWASGDKKFDKIWMNRKELIYR